jgi:hypothetical protein
MGNLLLLVAILVILAINVLFAMLRGLAKSRIRGICIVASAVLAVCATLIFKDSITSEKFIETILPWLRDQGQDNIKQFLEISPTLNDIVLKCISSLIAPLLSLIFFLIASFVSWVVYLVLTLVLGESLSVHNEHAIFRLPRALIWGAVQGIVAVVLILMPVSAYLDLAPRIMNAVEETEIMDEATADTVKTVMDDVVNPVNEGPVMTVYRALGGKAMTCLVTDFKIEGERTHLNEEIDSVAGFACNIVRLTKTQFTEYSSDEAVVIVAIADSFEESVLLPAIAGEVIFGVTDAWIDGEAFLGMKKPETGGDMGELTDEFLDSLIRILHADARNYPALQSDIRTVAEMVASLANHEIFANLSQPNALLGALSKSGVMKELIVAVGENGSMKILIPQITNMGVRAVAIALELPNDKAEVYHSLLQELTDSVGYVSRISADKARIKLLSTYFINTLEDTNLTVPKELADCIAVAIDRDLMKASIANELSPDDLAAFFRIYSDAVSREINFELVDAKTEYASTVYADMTAKQLANSGAVSLAKAMKDLAALEVNDGFDAAVKATLLRAFSMTDAADSDVAVVLGDIKLQSPVKPEEIEALASLATLDSFKTDFVTLEDLMVDPEEVVEKLNSQTIQSEAEAINSIFASIEGLLASKEGESPELIDIAEAVGAVLDSLKTGEIYGEERTAKLFTAVLQSKTVRDAASLTLETATEMAKKATSGNVNYTETFVSIARSVNVLTEMGKNGNEVKQEDLVKLVENINPQSAGMLEVYVSAERIEDYGVSSKYAETSADLLSSTFGYMADNELEDPEAEAAALNRVMDIAISANSHSSGKQLFSDGDREGVLPSATETVETILASESVKHSLKENLLDENGNVIEEKKDAFDLGRKLDEGSTEYKQFIDALDASYAKEPTEENKQTLTALAALFGIEY